MQFVIFYPIHAYRLEGSKAHMERDLRRLDAPVSNARQNLWREVQARGWGRYRPAFAGVHGLIAIPIAGAVRPVDIRWQGHMPQALDQAKEISSRTKPYAPFAEVSPGHDLRLQFIVSQRTAVLPRQFSARAGPGTPIRLGPAILAG